MVTKNDRLTILSEAEQFALYGLPDFDDGQRLDYLSLSESELMLACSRPGLHGQIYCALQLGYFKAKHAFFRFTWDDAQEDRAFILTRYFNGQAFEPVNGLSTDYQRRKGHLVEAAGGILLASSSACS